MFSQKVLSWFDVHGRHHLPWQKEKSAYHVWLSEVMLQQTQVTTVIPYFEKFITIFPTLENLAKANQDEVLALWSGLGYYSRARNLHLAAQMVMYEFAGKFPQTVEDLMNLPGIGRSTAHAILSIAWQQPVAILDGNVKRVLTRFYGIQEHHSLSHVEKDLWHKASNLAPQRRAGDYTQAMMDLGATLCTRSKPHCESCPIANECLANQQTLQHLIPVKKPKKIKPEKATQIFVIYNKTGQVLLEKRASKGIWGGLWTLPGSNLDVFPEQMNVPTKNIHSPQLSFRHTFTHFHLDIDAYTTKHWNSLELKANQQWLSIEKALELGLPAPIRKILEKFC